MKVTGLCGLSRNAGGLYYAVSALSRAMSAKGVDIAVYGPADPFVKEDCLAWSPVQTGTYRSFGPLSSSLSLRKMLRKNNSALVHQHGIWQDDQWAALQWQKKSGRPVVISPHGMLDPWAVRNSAWKKKLVSLLFAKKSLIKSNCLHALCESEAKSIRAYGLDNPIAVIPNGVNLPDFAESTLSFQHSPKKRKLLFLGRIHPKKGIKELIEAWAHVQRADWELIISGWDDGGHEEGLKNLAAKYGLLRTESEGSVPMDKGHSKSIRFAGPKFGEEKDLLLRDVDAFILPSFSEGLPMSVLEAWAYQLPVLMSNFCNIPEGFEARAAISVEPYPDSIVSGLNRLVSMTDEELRNMGQRGRELVEEKFTWDSVAEQMKSVYEWCVDGGEPPVCMQF